MNTALVDTPTLENKNILSSVWFFFLFSCGVFNVFFFFFTLQLAKKVENVCLAHLALTL